jgi:hypothetical protein
MEYFPANSGGGFASTWMMTRQIGDGIGTKAMEFGKAIGRMFVNYREELCHCFIGGKHFFLHKNSRCGIFYLANK